MIILDLEEGVKLFEKIRVQFSGDNEYLIFTGFLIKSVKLKSKEAYSTILHSYEEFLKTDAAFNSLYKSFGYKYFGIEKSKGGLMSLLE